MANQRDPDKRRVSFWINKDKKREFQTLLDDCGRNASEVIDELIDHWMSARLEALEFENQRLADRLRRSPQPRKSRN